MSETEPSGRYPTKGPRSNSSKQIFIIGIVFAIISFVPSRTLVQQYVQGGAKLSDLLWHLFDVAFNAIWYLSTFWVMSIIVQLLCDIRWHLAKNNSFKLGL